MQRDANFLPAILYMKNRSGQRSAVPQTLRAGRSFKKAVRFRGRQQIDDGLDTNHDRAIDGLLELEADFAGNFAAARRGAKGKTLGDVDRNRFVPRNISAEHGLAK